MKPMQGKNKITTPKRAKLSKTSQEWTNHRNTKSRRFVNFVVEPGFNLNSPTFSSGNPLNSGEKRV